MTLFDELGMTEALAKPWIEDTFFVPKPNCPEHIIDEVVHVLSQCGISLVAKYNAQFGISDIERIFGIRRDAEYMASAPLSIIHIRGENAIFRGRWAKRHIRAKYGRTPSQADNFLHTSDGMREIALLAQELGIDDFRFFADCSVPLEIADDKYSKERFKHLSWAGIYTTPASAKSAINWAVEAKGNGIESTIFLGFHLLEYGVIVYPHPFDYEEINKNNYSDCDLIERFAKRDALNVALPFPNDVTVNAPPAVIQDVHEMIHKAPFLNAILYACPSIDEKTERVLERLCHANKFGFAAGSFGHHQMDSLTVNAEKFRGLLKAWKIFY